MSINLGQVGNKPGRISVTIRNKETSASIPLGAPACLKLTSTAVDGGDGLDVVLPSTALVGNYQLLAGVNQAALAVNQFGSALAYGFSPFTLVKLNTRATSTDTWASVATVASGLLLTPDFTNNVWQTLANVGAQSSPQVLLLDTIASIQTVASSAANTAIVSTGLYRAFVRML